MKTYKELLNDFVPFSQMDLYPRYPQQPGGKQVLIEDWRREEEDEPDSD